MATGAGSGRLTNNVRRSTVTVRQTSNHSKTPGSKFKSSLKSRPPGVKYSWQGPSHRLDIVPPEEERQQLKSEEQEQKLKASELKCEDQSIENCSQCHSREEEMHQSVMCESLLKKLIEAEVDGQSIADKAAKFADVIQVLREDKRLTASDSAMILAQHLDQLDDSIAQFVVTNAALRCLLRDHHEQELNAVRCSEDRGALMTKLADIQDTTQILKNELLQKDRLIDELQLQMEMMKDHNLTVSSLQTSLDVTRAQLQKQLHQRDADCSHLAIEIQTLENQLAQERIEVDHLRRLLQKAKEKNDEDKEQFKKATRVQKLRAERSKDELGQMHAQILEYQAIIADQRVDIDTLQAEYSKIGREKMHSEAELSACKVRVDELEHVLEQMDADGKHAAKQLSSDLKDKACEASSLKLDNERLRDAVTELERKLSTAESDILQLRSNVCTYETLIDDYRKQLNESRRELDESMGQLEEQKHETLCLRQEGERELETVRNDLESRLVVLEPLPELLRSTESKLRDATNLLREYEARHSENVRHISDLTTKYEAQSGQLLESRQKAQQLADECRTLNVKLELLEKKQDSLEEQNRELVCVNAKKEEALQQANARIDEKVRENASLQRQIESAVSDIKQQKELEREHISLAERSLQARIVDLESQVSHTRAEVSRQKREKNEIERNLNSRLEDLKSRLEASHSTNRTMQNYVHFLKSAYANVFNDSTLGINVPPSTTFF